MTSFDDISNSGGGLRLGLGLALGLGHGIQNDESPVKNYYSTKSTTVEHYCSKKEEDHHRPCNKAYPSLTLAIPDDEAANNNKLPTNTDDDESDEFSHPPQATSSPSALVSSFSNSSSIIIKRERSDQELLELDQVVDKIPSSRAIIDLDENGNGNASKKLRLTKEQSAVLEDSFKENSTLNQKQKQELARKLNLRTRQVEVWFQNRRARTKLKQTEVDCEVLKKCCETLTAENKRLQKELQELKSTMKKTTPPPPPGPLYVHLPVASLKICPSCEKISGGNSSSNNNNNKNNGASPKTALLISTKVHPQYLYDKTNYSFTQSPAAC